MAGWTVVPNGDTSAWKPVEQPPAPGPEAPGFLENLGHAFGIGQQEEAQRVADFKAHPIQSMAENALGPAYSAAKALTNGFMRSTSEVGQAVDALRGGNPASAAVHGITAIPFVGPAMNKMAAEAPPTTPGQSYASRVMSAATPGNVGTALGTAVQVAPMVLGAADRVAPNRPVVPNPPVANAVSALSDAAKGDPDAAALKGLNVPAKSKFAQRFIQSADAARPYLQGAQNLADLQAKIPQAKAEVWGPYQRTIDAIGGKTVDGPDGPTTIQDLEDQRLQLSAINRGIKAGDPATLQLVQQKGLNQADLLAQESAVKEALDPHLEQAGIKPQLIRKTFGQISDVGRKVLGRSTVSETPTPYGIGQAANLSLKNPLKAPGLVAQGVRDIVAGRPLLSGSATDVNIREAFRNGGPKPDLGEFDPRTQVPTFQARQLPQGAIEMPPPAGPQAGPSAPAMNIAPDTRAARLGLLLKAPPIELPGAVEHQVPAYSRDTVAARQGRLLPQQSGAPTILPNNQALPAMTPGERMAAFQQYLRLRQQGQLPASVMPYRLPPPE